MFSPTSSSGFLFGLFLVILCFHKSECVCQMNNETFGEGEVWTTKDCLQVYTCLNNGSYKTTECTSSENATQVKSVPVKEHSFCCNLKKPNTDEKLAGCKMNNQTFEIGEQHDLPGKCFSNVCYGNNLWVRKLCGLVQLPEGWTRSQMDTSKPFPECCEGVVPQLDIVPDVLDRLPYIDFLDITYEDGLKVDKGKELTPTQVKQEPTVSFPAENSDWHLLVMVDPDAPSRKEPTLREVLHWLVVNIPGGNVTAGEVVAGYRGSGAPQGTGLHRYVFFVYKQPGKLTFDEPRVKSTSRQHRLKFSLRKFVEKYKLGDPVAFNVFQAQWDEYVPILQKMTDSE